MRFFRITKCSINLAFVNNEQQMKPKEVMSSNETMLDTKSLPMKLILKKD